MIVILKVLRVIAFIPVAFLILSVLFSFYYSSGVYCFGINPISITISVIGLYLKAFWWLWLICAGMIALTTTGSRLLKRKKDHVA